MSSYRPRVEMVHVYNISLTFSNVSVHDPDYRKDEDWIYDDWSQACTRMKRCLDEHPKADIVLSTELMIPEEYEALPADEDDAEHRPSKPGMEAL